MSNFDEAPPLPRQPTAISVPEAMGTGQVTETVESGQPAPLPAETHEIPPPPKFPSLTDVGLSSATAAAATMETSTATDTAPLPTITEHESAAPTVPEPESEVAPVAGTSEHVTVTSERVVVESESTVQVSTALPANIEAAIARDSVTPGTGFMKAKEIGQQLWTDGDQEELNRLLKEGQHVLIPPDVNEEDLPKVRHSYYVPVPVPQGDAGVVEGVDVTPEDRSVATRVAAWNQVVSRDDEDKDGGVAAGVVPVPVPVPAPVPGDAVEDVTGRSLGEERAGKEPEVEHVDDQTRETPVPASTETGEGEKKEGEEGKAEGDGGEVAAVEPAAKTEPDKVDVSQSIFGGHFLTVPVTTRKQREQSAVGTTDDVPGAHVEEVPTEVMLKSDVAAHINVTEDYGLQDGHMDGTNDAAFLKDGSLVTCGNDGKVCIWDMQERVVESEFKPYDGEPVTMVYPLQNEDQAQTKIIVTLSKSRLMRIWTVDKKSAIVLRSIQIKSSEKELYMSIPYISDDLKARATAAAYAAAITTTDPPKIPKSLSPSKETTEAPSTAAQADTGGAAAEPPAEGAAEETKKEEEAEEEEEEKESKRFSFKKVLSFGRTSSARKAVAS